MRLTIATWTNYYAAYISNAGNVYDYRNVCTHFVALLARLSLKVGKYHMLNVKLVQIVVLMSVPALLSMLAVACGSEEPAPTAAPAATEAPEPTAAPPADEEAFELKYSSPLSPPPFLISEVQKWWADEVAKRSNGRIVWTDFYWSGALTKAGETLEAVEVGLADAGMVALPYYPGKLPLGNWTYAVPFGPGDPGIILEVAQRLSTTRCPHCARKWRPTISSPSHPPLSTPTI